MYNFQPYLPLIPRQKMLKPCSHCFPTSRARDVSAEQHCLSLITFLGTSGVFSYRSKDTRSLGEHGKGIENSPPISLAQLTASQAASVSQMQSIVQGSILSMPPPSPAMENAGMHSQLEAHIPRTTVELCPQQM